MSTDGTGEDDWGEALALIVHDLRNPAATIHANLSFLRETQEGVDRDCVEALADAEVAVGDLVCGLEHLAWISRWLRGQEVARPSDGDVGEALHAAAARFPSLSITIDAPPGLRARAGGTLARLLEVLLGNSAQHGRGRVTLRARPEDREVIVELEDGGAAIAPELRSAAFTLPGQQLLKGRADGRYGRVMGLFVARLLADAMGASLEADGEEGAAVFRLRLPGLTAS